MSKTNDKKLRHTMGALNHLHALAELTMDVGQRARIAAIGHEVARLLRSMLNEQAAEDEEMIYRVVPEVAS